MSNINKLTTSFIKITNTLPKKGEEPGRIQHLRIDVGRRGAGVT
ncbi:MAG: hypothetical protein ACKPKO_31540 [Candidatus Fonsibacter sp.]